LSRNELRGWFTKRRESIAIKLTQDHAAAVLGTVTELEKAVMAASKGKVAEMKQANQRLFAYEAEADGIQRDVAAELTKGELPAKDREDLMHLINRLDDVADWAKDASRNLTILLEVKVTKDIWQYIVEMSHTLVESVWVLRRSIDALTKDIAGALEMLAKIDELEHKVDELYFEAKSAFFAHPKELTPPTFIVLRDLVHDMEQVADRCEDTADIIRVIAVRAH